MKKALIVSYPDVLGGKPVIAGTRISVELIMNFVAAGMSVDDLLAEYTELTRAEVVAAIDYAAKLVAAQKPKFNKHTNNLLPSTQ